jgi:protein-disulfide isomerase
MKSSRFLVGTILALLLTNFASAQEPPRASRVSLGAKNSRALAQDGITKQQADSILAELRAIRELLQKQMTQDRLLLVPAEQQPSTDQSVEVGVANHWHSLGREEAPLTLLEFTDYQCPFCRAFQSEVFPKIREQYVDTGKVRYISLDLPLGQHLEAGTAAEAARCAGDQHRYWEFRAAVLDDKRSPSEDILIDLARSLSLDTKIFRQCLTSHAHHLEVEEDRSDAASLQINATPTFVIGRTSQGRLQGTILRGVLPYPAFQAKLEEMLKTSAP